MVGARCDCAALVDVDAIAVVGEDDMAALGMGVSGGVGVGLVGVIQMVNRRLSGGKCLDIG